MKKILTSIVILVAAIGAGCSNSKPPSSIIKLNQPASRPADPTPTSKEIAKDSGSIFDALGKVFAGIDSKITDLFSSKDPQVIKDATDIKTLNEQGKQQNAKINDLTKRIDLLTKDIENQRDTYNEREKTYQQNIDKLLQKIEDDAKTHEKDQETIAKLKQEKDSFLIIIASIIAGIGAVIAGIGGFFIFDGNVKLGSSIAAGGTIMATFAIAIIENSVLIGIIGASSILLLIATAIIIAFKNRTKAIDQTVKTAQLTKDALLKSDPVSYAKIFGDPTSKADEGLVHKIQSGATPYLVKQSLLRQGFK